MDTSNFDLGDQVEKTPRNPYAVLKIEPLFRKEVQSDLIEKMRGYDNDAPKDMGRIRHLNWDDITQEPANLDTEADGDAEAAYLAEKTKRALHRQQIRLLEKELKGEKDETRQAFLRAHIDHRKEFLLLRAEIEDQRFAITQRCKQCLERVSELPDDKQTGLTPAIDETPVLNDAKTHTSTPRETASSLRARVEELKGAFMENDDAAAAADLTQAQQRVDKRLERIRLFERYQERILSILTLEQRLLYYDKDIGSRYRTISTNNHPDSNPDNEAAKARFNEAAKAYQQLMNADDDERDKLAYDLFAGVNTGLWTDQMKTIIATPVREFAKIFIREETIEMTTRVPCNECEGSGHIEAQEIDNKYPTVAVCGACEGEGFFPEFVARLRKALDHIPEGGFPEATDAAPVKKKKKKKAAAKKKTATKKKKKTTKKARKKTS